MEITGNILLRIQIWDLCLNIWFGTVDSLVGNVLLRTTFSDKLIKRIFHIERRVLPTNLQDVALLAANLTLPPIVTPVSIDAECALTGAAKEHLKAESDLHTNYTVRIVKAETVRPQSVVPIRVTTAMGGLISIEPMLNSGEPSFVSRCVG